MLTVETIGQYLARGGTITRCPKAYAAEAYTDQCSPLSEESAKELSNYYVKMDENWKRIRIYYWSRMSNQHPLMEKANDNITLGHASHFHKKRRKVSDMVRC